MNLKEICLTLCREIHKLVPYDRASINFPQGKDRFVVYAEESRLSGQAVPEGFSVVEGTATGWVMHHLEPVTCRDILTDDRFALTHQRYRTVGIRSYIILPLTVERELLGVLNLGSLSPDRFGQKELDILSPVAEILSLAIKNSRLYEESRAREEMQKLLKELSQDIVVLDVDALLQKLTLKIREVLKVDVSDVRLMADGEWRSIGVSGVEPGSLQPASSRVGHGLSRAVIQSGRPITVSDVTAGSSPSDPPVMARNGFRGYVGVPLFSRNGEVIGVLRVLTYRERNFTQEEVDLLQQLAGGAAIAFENSRLFKEVTQKSLHLEALINVNRDIASLLNRAFLLPHIADCARQFLGVDGASFRLVDGDCLVRAGHAGDEELLALSPRLRLGESISGKVVEENRAIAARNVFDDPLIIAEHRRILNDAGYCSFLGVPLRLGERVIGTINLYSKREREFRPDEIQLITAFADQAAIAVENSRLFEELRKKSAELEDAFKLKTDFLNTMAHELRTPLNVVIGTQQLLVEGSYGQLDNQQVKALSRIGHYSKDLLDLINEILDLMRLEAKKVTLHCEEFSVRDITDDLELSFDLLAREKGLKLKFDIADGMPHLWGDPGRLREVLQNLLANAVKYTERGKVELHVSMEKMGNVAWTVSDTGIGIRHTDLPHIFEPFFMAEDVDRRKYPGSGLGLSIVKRLVDLLEGDIAVESEHGRGSRFTVTLPLHMKEQRDYM
ncbi:MAG TPA: GAF domain-containing sensor histidine kinase [Verrucomicrobiae bacterium]|nr:GAF domain-containing sensor histidine kinase [Verrucomicrobiae bacterium]